MPTLPLFVTPEPDEPGVFDVRIDVGIGDDNVRAVLDTGGGSSTFATTPQTEHLDVLRPATSRGATGTVAPDEIVILPSLSLGPIVVRDLEVDRMPASDDRPSSVGVDVLGRHRCHFRFTSGVVELDEPVPDHVDLRPLRTLSMGQPVISVRLGANEATALWDTGAGLTIVGEQYAAAHPGLVEVTGQIEGRDSSGAPVSAQTGTMITCEIGGVTFAPAPCAVFDLRAINERSDIPLDLAIGPSHMVLDDWLFDFPAGVWAITSDHHAPSTGP